MRGLFDVRLCIDVATTILNGISNLDITSLLCSTDSIIDFNSSRLLTGSTSGGSDNSIFRRFERLGCNNAFSLLCCPITAALI